MSVRGHFPQASPRGKPLPARPARGLGGGPAASARPVAGLSALPRDTDEKLVGPEGASTTV